MATNTTTPPPHHQRPTNSVPLSPELIATLPTLPKCSQPTTQTNEEKPTKRRHRNTSFVPQSPNILKKATYYANPEYQRRVAKHLRTKSGRQQDYFARSFGSELLLARSLILLHQTLHIQKTTHNGMTQELFTFLLFAKLFCVHHGVDIFTAKQVALFANFNLFRNHSVRDAFNKCVILSGYSYINPLRPHGSTFTKWILSLKTRQLFRDIDLEFHKPFVITSPPKNSKTPPARAKVS